MIDINAKLENGGILSCEMSSYMGADGKLIYNNIIQNCAQTYRFKLSLASDLSTDWTKLSSASSRWVIFKNEKLPKTLNTTAMPLEGSSQEGTTYYTALVPDYILSEEGYLQCAVVFFTSDGLKMTTISDTSKDTLKILPSQGGVNYSDIVGIENNNVYASLLSTLLGGKSGQVLSRTDKSANNLGFQWVDINSLQSVNYCGTVIGTEEITCTANDVKNTYSCLKINNNSYFSRTLKSEISSLTTPVYFSNEASMAGYNYRGTNADKAECFVFGYEDIKGNNSFLVIKDIKWTYTNSKKETITILDLQSSGYLLNTTEGWELMDPYSSTTLEDIVKTKCVPYSNEDKTQATVNIVGNVTGNASSADKVNGALTIGTNVYNGSADVTIGEGTVNGFIIATESIPADRLAGGISGDLITDKSISVNKLVFTGTSDDTDNAAKALGCAPASHQHSAGDITSGTLDLNRIPTISDEKIGEVSTSKLIGTITNDQLAGSIAAEKLAGSISTSQIDMEGGNYYPIYFGTEKPTDTTIKYKLWIKYT